MTGRNPFHSFSVEIRVPLVVRNVGHMSIHGAPGPQVETGGSATCVHTRRAVSQPKVESRRWTYCSTRKSNLITSPLWTPTSFALTIRSALSCRRALSTLMSRNRPTTGRPTLPNTWVCPLLFRIPVLTIRHEGPKICDTYSCWMCPTHLYALAFSRRHVLPSGPFSTVVSRKIGQKQYRGASHLAVALH